MIHYVNRGGIIFILGLLLVFLGVSSHALAQGGENLTLSRKIEKSGERQYLVTVTLTKGDMKGYAKLEEIIPEGFVSTKKEARSANYISKDQKVKFIWMDLPSEKEFQVVYKLTQKRSKGGTYEVEGRFSCVSGEDLLRVEQTDSFEVKEPKLAKGVQKSSKQEEEPDEEEEKTKNEGEDSEASETKAGKTKDEKGEGEEKLASNEEGVGTGTESENASSKVEDRNGEKTEKENEKSKEEEEKSSDEDGAEWEKSSDEEEAYFSVQIGAFGEKKNDAYFKDRYDLLPEDIEVYQEGSLYKYTTGRFASYEKARQEKKRLRSNGLKGAFVVGFKGSEPVSASTLRK